MTNHEQPEQPRFETDVERERAYEEFRHAVRTRFVRYRDLSFSLPSETPDDLLFIELETPENKLLIVEKEFPKGRPRLVTEKYRVNVFHESLDQSVRQTSYRSDAIGPVTRRDADPGSLDPVPSLDVPVEELRKYLTKKLKVLGKKIRQEEEERRLGLNDQPITAEEANDVAELIRAARPPSPELKTLYGAMLDDIDEMLRGS